MKRFSKDSKLFSNNNNVIPQVPTLQFQAIIATGFSKKKKYFQRNKFKYVCNDH